MPEPKKLRFRRRDGTEFCCALRDGDKWCLHDNFIIIANPSHPPRRVWLKDGKVEDILSHDHPRANQ